MTARNGLPPNRVGADFIDTEAVYDGDLTGLTEAELRCYDAGFGAGMVSEYQHTWGSWDDLPRVNLPSRWQLVRWALRRRSRMGPNWPLAVDEHPTLDAENAKAPLLELDNDEVGRRGL